MEGDLISIQPGIVTVRLCVSVARSVVRIGQHQPANERPSKAELAKGSNRNSGARFDSQRAGGGRAEMEMLLSKHGRILKLACCAA